uniref:Uncharacterized protein n=1 Tax=Tetradesmus obliquus TaxID=3088 RepID=A0A383V8U2_TETOB|eukprot:jgi/Sobl393_1/12885/SZX61169.1
MSSNYYSKQAQQQLEEILSNRIAQLTLLETENARLKQKEHASISAPGSAVAQAVLQALEAKEQQAHAALAQLGCCSSSSSSGSSGSSSSYDELYTTRLLRRATADPAYALAIVNKPRSERLQHIVAAVKKMALLLLKYDSNAPSTSLGTARQQLHAVVDGLVECVVVAGLLDPPAKKMANMLVNLERLEFEAYPPEQHSILSAQLELLQLQQQQVQLDFEQQAAHLHELQRPHSVQQTRRTKEALQQQQQQQQTKPRRQQQGAQDSSASHQLPQTASASMSELTGARPSRMTGVGSAVSNPEAMLLLVSSKEQRDIEQQLDVIIEQLKMQYFCQMLQFFNVLTCKQLAGNYVDAWPFVPDGFSTCEALDELDWL